MKLEKQVGVTWGNLHLFKKNIRDPLKTLEQMGTKVHLKEIKIEKY